MSSEDEKIVLFTTLTGADASAAKKYLSATNYNVQTAYEMFSAASVDDGGASQTPDDRMAADSAVS